MRVYRKRESMEEEEVGRGDGGEERVWKKRRLEII